MKNSKYKIFIVTILVIFIFTLCISGAGDVLAQNSLTLTITPPLFRLNIEPGESWSSSLKVVNNNSYDITVYPTVVSFQSDGESGYGKFVPILDDSKSNPDLLANWITITNQAVNVPREKSISIPFNVQVPEEASPGGHYAAILVGTKPPSNTAKGAEVGVSSFVSSLLLIRVGGEVLENGTIREFSTDKSFYDKPEAKFSLRFENSGNVHIIPRGDIVIYNMWGKERGRILINKDSDFGNVLPQSVRQFNFTWNGQEDGFEIGRYQAVITLSFGSEEKQTLTRSINFWVIPLGPTLKFLGVIFGFIIFIILSVRAYVKKALRVYEGKTIVSEIDLDRQAFEAAVEPLREGIVDLRKSYKHEFESSRNTNNRGIGGWMSQYKKALMFLIVILTGSVMGAIYLVEVRSPIKDYSVSSHDNSSENKIFPEIKIVSSYDSDGEELRIKKLLEKNGLRVNYLEKSGDKINNSRTIVKFLGKYDEEADLIAEILGEESVLEEIQNQETDIIIITPDNVNR